MGKLKHILRSGLAVMFASFVTLSSFGLVLGLLWTLFDGGNTTELIWTILAAAFALSLGGFVVGWAAGEENIAIPLLYGFLAGALSFTYILGLGYLAVALGLVASVFAGMGGLVFRAWNLNRDGQLVRTA